MQFHTLNTLLGFLKSSKHRRQENMLILIQQTTKMLLFPSVLCYIQNKSIYYNLQENDTSTFIIKYREMRTEF